MRISMRRRSATRASVQALPKVAETRDSFERGSVVEAIVVRAVILIRSFEKHRGPIPR